MDRFSLRVFYLIITQRSHALRAVENIDRIYLYAHQLRHGVLHEADILSILETPLHHYPLNHSSYLLHREAITSSYADLLYRILHALCFSSAPRAQFLPFPRRGCPFLG
jgi:hypothetical protein